MNWWRGRGLPVAIYLGIAALVIGGLAWVTWKALQLEHADTIRLALWRLDSRVFPSLAREDSRPVAHYEPLFPPMPAIDGQGQRVAIGKVWVPTPLLTAEFPEWMTLHFVVDPTFGWRSPMVIEPRLAARLREAPSSLELINATPQRAQRLSELHDQFPVDELLQRFGLKSNPVPQQSAQMQQQEIPPVQTRGAHQPAGSQWLEEEYKKRSAQQSVVRNEGKGFEGNYSNSLNIPLPGKAALWDSFPGSGKSYACVSTDVEEMKPHWITGADGQSRMMWLRAIRSSNLLGIQGVLVDWSKLREVLLSEIRDDLLPDATLEPADDSGGEEEGAVRMTALPVQLVAGSARMSIFPLNTPLRWGLALAWTTAGLALLVVGLGGWALLDLSERRFRFVTAVTHELRTPLTSMRLFLDMMTSGMVRNENDRDDYLRLLDRESDRLNRLIGNVLDYARLERQKCTMHKRAEPVHDLVQSVHTAWEQRCRGAEKELVVEASDRLPASIVTDSDMCRQVLGNLIDNACKYSQGASDRRIWLRALPDHGRAVIFEVEDKGPGISTHDAGSVFRPFRRGAKANEVAGGVGLGLALAERWARMLGGRLQLKPDHDGGACFQFLHPMT